jgi:hypothetical protein
LQYATKIARLAIFLTGTALLLPATPASAQESSSNPANNVASAPTAALRDVLMAACSQSQNDFVHFLTARNSEAFSRLAPAARVALMKRFVLLDEPGKPSVEVNPSGRPTVRCETPGGAAEIQIGGADTQDNLAFLPVELRDATDTTGNNVQRVRMGLVREDGGWKVLSVGLLLLDLPALEVEWDTAEIAVNERAALDGLKKIGEALEAYRKTYSRFPDSLASLGPPLHGAASGDAAGLLDSDLANGMKNGYAFRYVILGGSSSGAPAKFEVAATPLTYGRTGRQSFFRDSAGGLHRADRQGALATEKDPRAQ